MSTRIFLGLVLVILGLSLIAKNFGFPLIGELIKLWPLIFIYFGLKLLYNSYKREKIWRRRKKMKEERMRILKLVEEGKVKAEEAEELLKKIEGNLEKEKRFLKINIIEKGKTKVNIIIPLSLLSWGLKLASKYGKEYTGKIDISPEEIEAIINNPDFRGRIVDINVEEENTQVLVEII
ncbi:MAG: DUF5668 domain-containing protein [Dictyoglomus sp.]|nr:DUF5668 domain-containing protein [Dictyoglomus sp.]MCX7942453.1 DUF5668 domain-containing protein [Dictyoglomaceae bacterium]MDW8189282.1 DUF5668 domain-containing protein [Dictyoglomus sp.]